MKRFSWLVILGIVIWTAPSRAQEPHAEVSFLAGWAFSEGADGDPVLAGDGNIYNRADPKSSVKWGSSIGALLGDGPEVGFLIGRQESTLKVSGTASADVGDMNVDTYHGYFAYNFGENDDPLRPYVMGGLGATHFGSVEYALKSGQTGTIRGVTRFSNILGAGVKLYPGPSVGVRFGVQWTPTYVSSNGVGFWCDVFWGCYVLGNFQTANQLDFSGGITLRF